MSRDLRFTIDGSTDLEAWLADMCQKVLGAVVSVVPMSKLEALMLGGGYGRGEGGVFRAESGDRPYGRLEFYVCIRGNRWAGERLYKDRLLNLGDKLSVAAGITVELNVLSLAKLRSCPPSVRRYELVKGHRWVWGDEMMLVGCERHRRAKQIPGSEAIRLLMSRCSGLLFVRQNLENGALACDEADFVARNLAEAEVALGDAFLAADGRYHWQYRERSRRLSCNDRTADFPRIEELARYHANGISFKLHPKECTESPSSLRDRHARLVSLCRDLWLWIEQRRLGYSFETPREYGLSNLNKCPETASHGNLLVNMSSFGLSGLYDRWRCRHPRERLLNSLPLLLWEPSAVQDSVALRHLQSGLRTYGNSAGEFIAAYQRLWARFN